MKRGEVWWICGEIKKKRPAVIVSNDASNDSLNRIQVVPLTSKTQRLYPNEAYVMLGGRKNKAMADQIATVSKHRCSVKIGRLSRSDMEQVEEAIRIQLGMDRPDS